MVVVTFSLTSTRVNVHLQSDSTDGILKIKKKKNEFNSQLLHLRFKCDSISGGFIYVAISQLSLVLNNRGVRTVRLQTWPVWTKQMGKMKWLAQCKLPSNLWTVSNFHNTFCLALHGVLGGFSSKQATWLVFSLFSHLKNCFIRLDVFSFNSCARPVRSGLLS